MFTCCRKPRESSKKVGSLDEKTGENPRWVMLFVRDSCMSEKKGGIRSLIVLIL